MCIRHTAPAAEEPALVFVKRSSAFLVNSLQREEEEEEEELSSAAQTSRS